MKHRHLILLHSAGACALAALLAQAASQSAARFTAHIVDAESGQPLAASVVITNAQGEQVEPSGEHDHVRYLRKNWCYVDGGFQLPRDATGLTVEIRRGHQTLPLRQTIAAGGAEQTFRLHRWINLAGEGYMNGDTHVHYLALHQAHLQMRAEDLEVLNLLTSDFTNDAEKLTGRMDPVSTPGHWVWVGQEFRDWQQGHLNLLRLREIVQPLGPFGGTFRNMSERHLLLAPAIRAAHQQGGTVIWAHFADLPGTESPIDIAMGLVDAFDIITSKDPLLTGDHWEPWAMERPKHLPPLPAIPGINLVYHYYNAGFRIPLSSGTDKMGDDMPVGSSRVYVRTSERSYDAWLDGLKAGNGFVTNGPILTFAVDANTPGDVVAFTGSKTVTARATARSVLPFTRLQIIVNGEAVAASGEPVRNADGVYAVALSAPVKLDRSSWIAARVAEPDPAKNRILPRRMTVFAHSNPVFFHRDGRKVRVQDSIDYLTLYLRYSEHWFRTAARFETAAAKQEALDAVQWALDYYSKL